MNEPTPSGSRDTGSDQPSGGPAERPSGAVEGNESVPQHGDAEDFETGFTTSPPRDAEPAVPPYEGRKSSGDPEEDAR
ncbi:hypothetical protein [Mycolicibacterium vaccae]|uniref:hypothetical protein n=1 Tax=Mycolicibacterium vaccae TaxID=1810 RepID=UPI003D03E56E